MAVGFQRLRVRGEPYPALIAARGQTTTGCVYTGLTPTAWQRLDDFEGEYYDRQPIRVQTTNNQTMTACTYILRSEYAHILTDEEWDFERFLADGKRTFESAYKGYQTLPDTTGDPTCKR